MNLSWRLLAACPCPCHGCLLESVTRGTASRRTGRRTPPPLRRTGRPGHRRATTGRQRRTRGVAAPPPHVQDHAPAAARPQQGQDRCEQDSGQSCEEKGQEEGAVRSLGGGPFLRVKER